VSLELSRAEPSRAEPSVLASIVDRRSERLVRDRCKHRKALGLSRRPCHVRLPDPPQASLPSPRETAAPHTPAHTAPCCVTCCYSAAKAERVVPSGRARQKTPSRRVCLFSRAHIDVEGGKVDRELDGEEGVGWLDYAHDAAATGGARRRNMPRAVTRRRIAVDSTTCHVAFAEHATHRFGAQCASLRRAAWYACSTRTAALCL
jgi:hypothetical protein